MYITPIDVDNSGILDKQELKKMLMDNMYNWGHKLWGNEAIDRERSHIESMLTGTVSKILRHMKTEQVTFEEFNKFLDESEPEITKLKNFWLEVLK